jgi:FlaA1/EpsC-like NDP-sugar epimerase
LLPRDPIQVDLDAILGYVKGKTILVTGGGGSIGSEICRQLAGHDVGHLIIFDIYENNAYQIQKSLEWEFPDLKLTVLILCGMSGGWNQFFRSTGRTSSFTQQPTSMCR